LNNLFTAIRSEKQIHCKETLQRNKETKKQKNKDEDETIFRPVPSRPWLPFDS